MRDRSRLRPMALGCAVALGLAALTDEGSAQLLQDSRGTASAGAAVGAGPASDATLEAARAAFEQLPEADRIAVQDALVWTGDYSSTTTGTFGRRTFEGIEAYQRRTRQAVTGILDGKATAALLAAAARARTAAGFAPVTDPASGVVVGVPGKLLPKRSLNPNGGARFQSRDDRVTLDLRAQPGGAAELKELYERNIATTAPGRNVTYKLLRPDFFVVTGETATGRFYTRYAMAENRIRGFALGYDKTMTDFDRIVIAMSNSFVPFPGAPALRPPAAVAGSLPVGAAPARETGPATAESGGRLPPRTGLVVAPRLVLTGAPSGGCTDPTVAGARARLVRSHGGLALLETTAPQRSVTAAFAPDGQPGAGAVAMFLASHEGGRAVVTPALPERAGHIVAALQEGAVGAVIVDPGGAVLGMVTEPSLGRRAVAGLVPPASHAFVGSGELRGFLGQDARPVAPPALVGDAAARGGGAAALAGALVPVVCPAPVRSP